MRFKISTSKRLYRVTEDWKTMKKLGGLGFTFRPETRMNSSVPSNIHFIEGEPSIDISSLEDMIKFTEKFGAIILTKVSIEICNGYRE